MSLEYPEPADLDRLMSRLAYGGVNRIEAAVATAVMLAALDGKERPQWKELADQFGFRPTHVSRAKTSLGNRLVKTDVGLRVNLDPGLWFVSNHEGKGFEEMARKVARARKRYLPESISGDIPTSPNGSQPAEETNQNGEVPTPKSDQIPQNGKSESNQIPEFGYSAHVEDRACVGEETKNTTTTTTLLGGVGGSGLIKPHDPDGPEMAAVVAVAAECFGEEFAARVPLHADGFASLSLLGSAIRRVHARAVESGREIGRPWPWTDSRGEEHPGAIGAAYLQELDGNGPVAPVRPRPAAVAESRPAEPMTPEKEAEAAAWRADWWARHPGAARSRGITVPTRMADVPLADIIPMNGQDDVFGATGS